MKTLVTTAAIVSSLALGASVATARQQQESRPHYRRSAQAIVDTVDPQGRIVELKRPEGFYIRLHVPETFTNFDTFKPGQTVNVTYFENVITKIEKAGAEVHNREPAVAPANPSDVNNSKDLLRMVTATITAIDPKWGNITYTEKDRPYTARVETKDVSKGVKPGDKVTLTYVQATLFEVK
jgi:hypothetical protein